MKNRFLSKMGFFYLAVAYVELMAMCLFGDTLPAMGWAKDAYDAVRGSWLFFSVNYFLIFVAGAYILWKQIGGKVFCVGRCVAWGMSAVFVGFISVKHPRTVDVLGLVFSILLDGFFIEFAKWVDGWQRKKKTGRAAEGFVVDYADKADLLNVGWNDYADNLAARLECTDTSRAAFAVALTGKWGSGKTTFLGNLKDAFQKRQCAYMEFNPWLSNTPKGIIEDFFKALRGKLRKNGLYLDNEIEQYVKTLLKSADVSLAASPRLSVKPWNSNNEDLFSLHKKLSDALRLLDGNLFVLIDDIDRLHKEEIFEVLRLVRNTADFNNLVYVVTCDKDYVTEMLKNLEIAKPEEYIKKIFQLELKFPRFENYLFTELFNRCLANYTHYEGGLKQEVNLLEPKLTQRGINMTDYFENFRDVKRLVNSFAMNLDYIAEKKVTVDFDVTDLFLMHLLESTDEKAYLDLKNKTWELLCVDSSDKKYIHLKKDQELKDGGFVFSYKTKRLLDAMFKKVDNGKNKPKRNSIRRQDRIYNYFSYRPYAYQMSLTDFVGLMKNASEETIREYVKNSSVGIFSKKESIYAMMKEQWLVRLDDATVNNFLTLLMAWTERYQNDTKPEKIGDLYRDVLGKSRINTKHVDMVKGKLTPFLKSLKDPNHGFILQQKIYAKMVPCFVDYYGEGDEEYFPECIYGRDELVELMKENTCQFLQAVKPSAGQILERSRLYDFIQYSIVYNEAYTPNELPQFDFFPVADELIAYFSKRKEGNNLHLFTSKFELRNYYAEEDSSPEKEMKKDVTRYFADVKFYKRFIQECCNGTEEEVKEYLEKNGI